MIMESFALALKLTGVIFGVAITYSTTIWYLDRDSNRAGGKQHEQQ